MAADAAALGIDLSAYLARVSDRSAEIVLWEGNLPAWSVWKRAQTQWRYAGLSGALVGLDYEAVARIADGLGVPWDETLIDDIAACEAVVLEIARQREAARGH